MWKPQSFFLLHDPKNMCKLRKILHWKPKIVRKKSIVSLKLSKFSKYIVRGYPYPLQKNFLLQIVVKMLTFWDDPPPVVKIYNFFFRMNPSLSTYYWGFESLIGLYKDPMCLKTLCRHSEREAVQKKYCWEGDIGPYSVIHKSPFF